MSWFKRKEEPMNNTSGNQSNRCAHICDVNFPVEEEVLVRLIIGAWLCAPEPPKERWLVKWQTCCKCKCIYVSEERVNEEMANIGPWVKDDAKSE